MEFQSFMTTQLRLLLFAASTLAVAVSPLHAQIVADGATNTLSNVTNPISGAQQFYRLVY